MKNVFELATIPPHFFIAKLPEFAASFEARIGRSVASIDDIRSDVLANIGVQSVEYWRDAIAAFAAWVRDFEGSALSVKGLFRKDIWIGSGMNAVRLLEYFQFQVIENGKC